MALSLREKLQKASQANIATNAAKTLEKLDIMERPATPNVVSEPEDKKATQSPTHSTTQLPSRLPTKLPTERPNYPVDYPLDDPVDHPTTQSPTHSTTQNSAYPVDYPLNHPVGDPVTNPGVKSDLWDMLTGPQRKVLAFLVGRQGEIVRYAEITRGTSVPVASAQTVCKRLKALGVLSSQYGCRGVIKGMRFSLDKRFLGGPIQLAHPVDDPVTNPSGDPLDYPLTHPVGEPTTHSTTHSTTQKPLMKKDRKNLSFSLEVARVRWPQVLAAGFGPDQLDQVLASRDTEGKPTIDNGAIAEALDRAEWELANTGGLADLKGQKPVSNIPGYLFKSLVTWGTFRTPPGYALHEEVELAELKKVLERKRRAQAEREDVQFENWKLDQGEAGIEAAMKGFPGGNRDAWLKNIWRNKCQQK